MTERKHKQLIVEGYELPILKYKKNLTEEICPLCGKKHKANDWVIHPYDLTMYHINDNKVYIKEMPKWFIAGNSCGYAVEIPNSVLKNNGYKEEE